MHHRAGCLWGGEVVGGGGASNVRTSDVHPYQAVYIQQGKELCRHTMISLSNHWEHQVTSPVPRKSIDYRLLSVGLEYKMADFPLCYNQARSKTLA